MACVRWHYGSIFYINLPARVFNPSRLVFLLCNVDRGIGNSFLVQIIRREVFQTVGRHFLVRFSNVNCSIWSVPSVSWCIVIISINCRQYAKHFSRLHAKKQCYYTHSPGFTIDKIFFRISIIHEVRRCAVISRFHIFLRYWATSLYTGSLRTNSNQGQLEPALQ